MPASPLFILIDGRQVDCMTVAYIAQCGYPECHEPLTAVSSNSANARRLITYKAKRHWRMAHADPQSSS